MPKYIPFLDGKWKFTVGLKEIEMDSWLDKDQGYDNRQTASHQNSDAAIAHFFAQPGLIHELSVASAQMGTFASKL